MREKPLCRSRRESRKWPTQSHAQSVGYLSRQKPQSSSPQSKRTSVSQRSIGALKSPNAQPRLLRRHTQLAYQTTLSRSRLASLGRPTQSCVWPKTRLSAELQSSGTCSTFDGLTTTPREEHRRYATSSVARESKSISLTPISAGRTY